MLFRSVTLSAVRERPTCRADRGRPGTAGRGVLRQELWEQVMETGRDTHWKQGGVEKVTGCGFFVDRGGEEREGSVSYRFQAWEIWVGLESTGYEVLATQHRGGAPGGLSW